MAVLWVLLLYSGFSLVVVCSLATAVFSLVAEGFPGSAVVKNPTANEGDAGDVGSIPGWGRSPGVRNGNPLQYSCLANPMDRGAWWASLGGHKESDTIKHAIVKYSAPPVAEHRL